MTRTRRVCRTEESQETYLVAFAGVEARWPTPWQKQEEMR